MSHVVGRIDGMAAAIGGDRELERGRIDDVRGDVQLLVAAVQGLSEDTQASASPLRQVILKGACSQRFKTLRLTATFLWFMFCVPSVQRFVRVVSASARLRRQVSNAWGHVCPCQHCASIRKRSYYFTMLQSYLCSSKSLIRVKQLLYNLCTLLRLHAKRTYRQTRA